MSPCKTSFNTNLAKGTLNLLGKAAAWGSARFISHTALLGAELWPVISDPLTLAATRSRTHQQTDVSLSHCVNDTGGDLETFRRGVPNSCWERSFICQDWKQFKDICMCFSRFPLILEIFCEKNYIKNKKCQRILAPSWSLR